MTTRKPKPTYPHPIEFPAERLQLMPVSVEHKAPVHSYQTSQAGMHPPSLPDRGKITVH